MHGTVHSRWQEHVIALSLKFVEEIGLLSVVNLKTFLHNSQDEPHLNPNRTDPRLRYIRSSDASKHHDITTTQDS